LDPRESRAILPGEVHVPQAEKGAGRGITRGAGTDSELWQAVLDGSEQAWEALVRRYEALVYTVATRFGLSLADSADCFQETWLKLYTHRKTIGQADRISAWLVTTTKREALRLRRQGSRMVAPQILDVLEDARPLADAELTSLQERARLQSALDRLDHRCHALLRALFFDPGNPSYDSIAQELGLPKNSIGPVRSRCLARLKEVLAEEGWL
jgi:RNA polymerase sigma factor (sigma-70 family)